MDDSWLKSYRKTRYSAFACKPDYLSVWTHLLWMANYHQEKQILINGRKMILKPGQLITSRLKISAVSGVQQHKVDRILNYFKSEQQIEQVNMHSCRLISIVNWKTYQNSEQQIEHGMSSECAATEQPLSTIKKDKNRKKDKKEKKENTDSLFAEHTASESISVSKSKGTIEQLKDFCISLGLPARDGETLFYQWEGNGWKIGGRLIKDYQSVIRNWNNRHWMPSQTADGNGNKVQASRFETRLERTIRVANEYIETVRDKDGDKTS